MAKKLAPVNMEVLRRNQTNIIVDGGFDVNILLKDTWRSLGKPTIWSPTFQLVDAKQQGIKVLGVLMGQKVIIKTKLFC
jgi:hypothetical protein